MSLKIIHLKFTSPRGQWVIKNVSPGLNELTKPYCPGLHITALPHHIHNPLQWRHNEHDGIWNHQPYDCWLNRLFRRRSKKTSKLRVTGLCAGNSPGPVNSLHKGPVTRKMFPFDDVIMQSSSKYSVQPYTNDFIHYGMPPFFSYHSWGLNIMATMTQTTFSNIFSLQEICAFWFNIHWLNFVTHGPTDEGWGIMAQRQTGDKPLPKPIVIKIYDAKRHH